MASFYIYDHHRVRAALLQNTISIQWLEHFQDVGEVKIVTHVTDDNVELLAEGNRVYNTDSDCVAIIREVELMDGVDGDSLTARAVLTARQLDDRVVMATLNVSNVEAGMYKAFADNRRGLPIRVAAAKGFSASTDTQITWNSVLDAEIKLAEIAGLGFKVVFDPRSAIETFNVYSGTDRTDVNSDAYVGFFGETAGNLSDAILIDGSINFKNVAVVAGEDSAEERKVVIVSLGSSSGEDRREMYVDARDLQSEYQEATPTGEVDEDGNPLYTYETKTYTETEYTAMLEARGFEGLNEHLRDYVLECSVDQTSMQYGVDYFLGDIMPLVIPHVKKTVSARIASALLIYESTGRKVELTMSNFNIGE